MALGYGILNVAVICDSSWSGAVPVAASVEACFFTGRSTGTPGSVPVADSYSEGIGNGRLVSVAASVLRAWGWGGGRGGFAVGWVDRAALFVSSPNDSFLLAPPSPFLIPFPSPPSLLDVGHLLWGSFLYSCLPWYLLLVDIEHVAWYG